MEKELSLKHLAPYLPYGLIMKIDFPNKSEIGELKSLGLHPGTGNENRLTIFVKTSDIEARQIIFRNNGTNPICKPILFPLSYIHARGVYFNYGSAGGLVHAIIRKEISIGIFNVLVKEHWDVFNLIPAGLAIDKNTIT